MCGEQESSGGILEYEKVDEVLEKKGERVWLVSEEAKILLESVVAPEKKCWRGASVAKLPTVSGVKNFCENFDNAKTLRGRQGAQ